MLVYFFLLHVINIILFLGSYTGLVLGAISQSILCYNVGFGFAVLHLLFITILKVYKG